MILRLLLAAVAAILLAPLAVEAIFRVTLFFFERDRGAYTPFWK